MDLYMQIGIFLLFTTMFALLAYFYADSMERGYRIEKSLSKPSENFSLDTTVTSPTFFVDTRVFEQWALNGKGQRDIYLIYAPLINPDQTTYGQYLRSVNVTLGSDELSSRTLVINPQSSSYVNNAFYVNDQSEKTLAFIKNFTRVVENTPSSNGVVTVRTFADPTSQETVYVCFIN